MWEFLLKIFFFTACSICCPDWEKCTNTCRSRASWCIFLRNSLISRTCEKQRSPSHLQKLHTDPFLLHAPKSFGFDFHFRKLMFSVSTPTTLYASNKSSLGLVTNPEFHKWMKIAFNFHFSHEHYESKTMTIPHLISTTNPRSLY